MWLYEFWQHIWHNDYRRWLNKLAWLSGSDGQREAHKYGLVAIASKKGQIVPFRRTNGNLWLRGTVGSTPYREYVQDWKQFEEEIREGKTGWLKARARDLIERQGFLGKAGLLKQRSGGGMLDLSEHSFNAVSLTRPFETLQGLTRD